MPGEVTATSPWPFGASNHVAGPLKIGGTDSFCNSFEDLPGQCVALSGSQRIPVVGLGKIFRHQILGWPATHAHLILKAEPHLCRQVPAFSGLGKPDSLFCFAAEFAGRKKREERHVRRPLTRRGHPMVGSGRPR
jgi:hypothetical protein